MKGAMFDYIGTLVHEIFYCRHSLVCAGFNLWKSILPEKAFFGEGSPSVIMTDDSDAERAALAACFPIIILPTWQSYKNSNYHHSQTASWRAVD